MQENIRVSKPLTEGRTRSNIKNTSQSIRLAAPPPPINKPLKSGWC